MAALCAVAYANSLGNDFVYDDIPIILTNPAVVESVDGRPVPWYEPWRRPYWPDTNRRADTDVLYRPFAVQTFAWDMRFLGPSAWWFHLVNVALHATVSVGVLWLARRLTDSSGAAVAASCLFAVHPIHVEAVTGIVGRAELLAAVGVIGVLAAGEAMLRARRAPAAVGAGVAAVLLGAVAMFSKESGAAAIPTWAAYAWWRRRRREGDDTAGRRVWILLAFLSGVLLVYLAARYHVCGGRLRIEGQLGGAGNVLHEAAGTVRALTWVSLIGRYVGLMAWPGRLLADYSFAVVRPTQSVFEPYFVLGAASVAVLIVAAHHSIRHGTGAAFVAVAGLLCSYILVSNSVILIAVMMAERWFYAPSAWLLILVAMAGQRARSKYFAGDLWRRLHQMRAPQAALVVLVALLCLRTWLRNADWTSTERLLASDIEAQPPGHRSAHFLASLANTRLSQGRLDEAEALAREAVATYGESASIRWTLGNVLFRRQKYGEAQRVLEEAVRVDPRNQDAVALLERVRLAATGLDPEAALRRALQSAEANPRDPAGWYAAGYCLESLGRFLPAAEHYLRAAELQPDNREAWLAWARTLAAGGDVAAAVAAYERILARWPDDWQAHANIATQLMQPAGPTYRPDEAVAHAERARATGPTDMQVQLTVNLAEVCASVGRADRAAALYEEVLKMLPAAAPQRSRYEERLAYLRRQ